MITPVGKLVSVGPRKTPGVSAHTPLKRMWPAPILALLVACYPTGPIPVAIVAQPQVKRIDCLLSDPPVPPDDIALNFDDPNIIARTSVNFGRFNELLHWARDMMGYADTLRECLEQMEIK